MERFVLLFEEDTSLTIEDTESIVLTTLNEFLNVDLVAITYREPSIDRARGSTYLQRLLLIRRYI